MSTPSDHLLWEAYQLVCEKKIQPVSPESLARSLWRDVHGDDKMRRIGEQNLGRYQAGYDTHLTFVIWNDILPNIKAKFGSIHEMIKRYGWYVSAETDYSSYKEINVEPNYSERIEHVPRFIYHFTHRNLKERILRQGLTVRMGMRKTFQYPPRLYFLLDYDPPEMAELAAMIFTHGQSGPDYVLPDIIVLRIDTGGLFKGTKFFKDNSTPFHDAAWTYSNIPARAIKVVYEGKLEELETSNK